MKFKFLPHTADVKFQAFGKSLEEAFVNSALALVNVISKDKIKSVIKKKISIQIEGADMARLLYDFLEEFLYFLDTENFLLSKINNLKIKEDAGAYFISCDVLGDKGDDYELEHHVKAITYNEMFVKKVKGEKNKYVCQVVVDV